MIPVTFKVTEIGWIRRSIAESYDNIVTPESIRDSVHRAQVDVAHGRMMGEYPGISYLAGSYGSDRVNLAFVSHKVTALWLLDETIWATIQCINTDAGLRAVHDLRGLVTVLRGLWHESPSQDGSWSYKPIDFITVDLRPCEHCLGRGYFIGIGGREVPCDGGKRPGTHLGCEEIEAIQAAALEWQGIR
jgi:hypothetical protein